MERSYSVKMRRNALPEQAQPCEVPARIRSELADVLEVVRSTCAVLGRNSKDLDDLADVKRKERGGFEKGLLLVETEEVPLLGAHTEVTLFPDGSKLVGRKQKKHTLLPAATVHTRKDTLLLSLVPPLCAGTPTDFKVLLPDFELEAHVSYKNKEIRIVFRKPTPVDAPNHLTLDFGL